MTQRLALWLYPTNVGRVGSPLAAAARHFRLIFVL